MYSRLARIRNKLEHHTAKLMQRNTEVYGLTDTVSPMRVSSESRLLEVRCMGEDFLSYRTRNIQREDATMVEI